MSKGTRVEHSGADRDDEDRARTQALRARIASLAAGPDASLSPESDDMSAAVHDAVTRALFDILPGLVHEEVRRAFAAHDSRRPAADVPIDDVGGEFEALRHDLADALDYVQQEIIRQAADRFTALEESVGALLPATTAGSDPELTVVLADLRGALVRAREDAAAARAETTRVGEQVLAAGRLLVDYLAKRDVLAERVRDEHAAALVRDLASTMSDKDRAAAGKRIGGRLRRRRDARDADRWRENVPAAPEAPAGFASEQEVAALLRSPEPAPAGSPAAAAKPAPVTAAEKFAAKAPTKRAPTKGAPTKRAPATKASDKVLATNAAAKSPARKAPAKRVPAKAVAARGGPKRPPNSDRVAR